MNETNPTKDSMIAVILKLRDGAQPPDYVSVRCAISDRLITADVTVEDRIRLDTDPAVEAVEGSRPLFIVD